MKHEIWVSEGESFAHHFRISVIDTLIVNTIHPKIKQQLKFTRRGIPQMHVTMNPLYVPFRTTSMLPMDM